MEFILNEHVLGLDMYLNNFEHVRRINDFLKREMRLKLFFI